MNEEAARVRRMSKLDTVERLLKIFQNIMILVMLGGILFFLGPETPRIVKELQKSSVSGVDLGLIKFKIDQAEENIKTALQGVHDTSEPEDARVPDELKPIAVALESIRDAGTDPAFATSYKDDSLGVTAPFWVYLGARRGDMWITSLFDFREIPAPGAIIQSTSDVFRRQRAPEFSDGQWTKGEIVGVLKAGEAVKVVQIEHIPGTDMRELWWAEVVQE